MTELDETIAEQVAGRRFRSAWRNLRVREALLASSVAGLFVCWPIGAAFGVFSQDFAVGMVLAGAAVASGVVHALFRCPRCGRRFFLRAGHRSIFTSRCLHCGLPKLADREDAQSGPYG